MSFTTVDPLTGLAKSVHFYHTEDQVLKSIEVLSSAQSTFSKLKVSERQKIIQNVGLRLSEKKELFAALMTSEMGKPMKEAILEVDKCIRTMALAGEADLSFLEPRQVLSVYKKSSVSHEALGVIYAIMPWNFPLWQVVRMCVPALIAGNTILLKHSELTPLIAQALHELFEDVYSAPILINNYITHHMTDFVLKNPQVGGVSLTGSVEAGRSVYKIAAQNLKKAVLELGGSDPYIVLPDADLTLAAKKIANGRLVNCGQTCISVKRVFVHEDILDDFLNLLKAEFDRFVYGDPKDLQTDIGPLAHPRFKESLNKQIQLLLEKTDAKMLYSKPHGQREDSSFVEAQIYLVSQNLEWLKDQEFFAPVLLMTTFKTDDEVIRLANSTHFALGAGIFSEDLQRADRLAHQIIAGQVVVNGLVASDLSLPFGGFKNSGLGRELGQEGYLEFTQTKVISYA